MRRNKQKKKEEIYYNNLSPGSDDKRRLNTPPQIFEMSLKTGMPRNSNPFHEKPLIKNNSVEAVAIPKTTKVNISNLKRFLHWKMK